MKRSCISIVIFLILSVRVSAETTHEKIDCLVSHFAVKGFLNGAVLVIESGEVIYRKAYGMANLEWDTPHITNGVFQIYSMSKQFTSLLMLQLVEEGKVSLDDPITKHLESYRRDTGDRILVRHVLSHTHGIAMPDWSAIPASLEMPLDTFVTTHLSGDLMFDPGSDFHYGSVGRGHVVAAAIIEKVTGQSFETVLKERILDPLGMRQSGIFHHRDVVPRYAPSYRRNGENVIHRIDRDSSQKMGASSMISTLKDLYLWDRALYTEKLLSQKTLQKMYAPLIPENGIHYGLGVHISEMTVDGEKKKLVWHGGGGVNLICRSVEDGHTVIFLNNMSIEPDLLEIAVEIFNIIYDQPYHIPKIAILGVMFQTMTTSGFDDAVTMYHHLKTEMADYYHFDEDQLDQLGHWLMNQNRFAEAINVLKLNVSQFPRSDNVYDSLGEAYMTDGQVELAIENFKKSFEINPDNQNIADKIRILEDQLKKSE